MTALFSIKVNKYFKKTPTAFRVLYIFVAAVLEYICPAGGSNAPRSIQTVNILREEEDGASFSVSRELDLYGR